MKKKVLNTVLAFAILIPGAVFYPTGDAEAQTDLREKLQELEEKRNSKQAESDKTKEEIKELEEDIEKAHNDMRELDEQITETNDKVNKKEDEVTETEERVDELRSRIKELEERIAERDKLLKDRVRAMYQNGGSVNYIEVLMGAKSFGDFLDRVSALNKIADQDREILEAHITDQEELKEAKKEVETELKSLEENLEELEKLQEKLKEKRKEKKEFLGDLESEEKSLQDMLSSLEDEEGLLKKQEEAAKKELAAQKRSQQSSVKHASLGKMPSIDSGGSLMMPATGRISSGYGPRWGSIHHGIDIGQGGRSNVPIVAAESGTVVLASYMNGYGNTVMISHRIDGRQVTTLYAHMASSNVSAGERVERGEQIGIMGNTGASNGPHVHFEVHEGPWNGAKSNSVDPRKYL